MKVFRTCVYLLNLNDFFLKQGIYQCFYKKCICTLWIYYLNLYLNLFLLISVYFYLSFLVCFVSIPYSVHSVIFSFYHFVFVPSHFQITSLISVFRQRDIRGVIWKHMLPQHSFEEVLKSSQSNSFAKISISVTNHQNTGIRLAQLFFM